LGQNGSVKLAPALSHIVPNVVHQTFEGVHGLVIEKAKPKRPSISKENPQQQNHVKMNTCILGNAMTVQRQNDQKVASRAKAQPKWDKLVIVTKQCS
jgi:peroxiredoxin family protein